MASRNLSSFYLRCFNNNSDSSGIDCLSHGNSDLFCESFLYLNEKNYATISCGIITTDVRYILATLVQLNVSRGKQI